MQHPIIPALRHRRAGGRLACVEEKSIHAHSRHSNCVRRRQKSLNQSRILTFRAKSAKFDDGSHLKVSSRSQRAFSLKAMAAWGPISACRPDRPRTMWMGHARLLIGTADDRTQDPSQNGLSLPSAGEPRSTLLDAPSARKPRPSLEVAHFGDHTSPGTDLRA